MAGEKQKLQEELDKAMATCAELMNYAESLADS